MQLGERVGVFRLSPLDDVCNSVITKLSYISQVDIQGSMRIYTDEDIYSFLKILKIIFRVIRETLLK